MARAQGQGQPTAGAERITPTACAVVDVIIPTACIRGCRITVDHSAGPSMRPSTAEARRNLRPPEFPTIHSQARQWLKHGEIEIGVLRGQCSTRRIRRTKTGSARIDAWERQRNAAGRPPSNGCSQPTKPRQQMGRAYPVHIQRVISTVTPVTSRNRAWNSAYLAMEDPTAPQIVMDSHRRITRHMSMRTNEERGL